MVGYRYRLDRYLSDHLDHPRRVVFGSESFPKEVFEAWDLIEKTPHVIGDFTWTAMDYLGEAGGQARRLFAWPSCVRSGQA